jgi:hypothetical protein
VGRSNERVPAAGALVEGTYEHAFDAPAISTPPIDCLLLRQLQTVDESIVIRQPDGS